MPEPLDYASPSFARPPHSELGSLALALTAIWLVCATTTLTAAAAHISVALALAIFTLAAMVTLVPFAFLISLMGVCEKNRRHALAYVAAAINGAVLLAGLIGFGWDRLL